ncbi:MAG: Ldh family oxidoreductase [Planctomycetota bacterium]
MGQVKTNTGIPIKVLEGFCQGALRSLDVSVEHAQQITDVLVTTDTWGVYTHGTKLLPGYVRRLRLGGLKVDGEPSVVAEGPAWALVDGRSLPAQVTSQLAMQSAIDKARETGIAYAGVRNSCHFGAAGYYAWQAAKQGMIGLAMANDIPSVAAPGSRKAVIGSNPIAYGIPAGRHDPILLDMSIAAVAGGKVYARCKRGEPIPAGWLIGPDGQPTTDGSLYPHETSLAPVGAHKGYGIGLLIESLSAVLTGASVTWNVGSWIFDEGTDPTDHGAAFMAIDTTAITPSGDFCERIDALIEEIHAAPTADECQQLMVPGEYEWTNRRQALHCGVDLPVDVVEALTSLAAELGMEFPEESAR